MPIIQTFYPSKNSIISVWKIEETIAQLEMNIKLSAIDELKYRTFTVEKRKKEWLITRIMLSRLMGDNTQIIYDENRNPSLSNSDTNISISHCRSYVCIFLDKKKHIGIDIEIPDERILKIASKFLSDKELAEIPVDNSIHKLTICWCIKEAMYKYYSRKKVDFKTELQIDSFELKSTGIVWAIIVKQNFKKLICVNYLNQPNYCMAFVSGD